MFVEKNKGIIERKRCIYCKRNVNTCNEKPVCSRKDCKRLRKK